MQLTQESDYAVRAMIYLANAYEDGQPVQAGEIGDKQVIPKNFLLKIIRKLCNSGLVKSYRGVNGGYTLAKPAAEISLLEIIDVTEGDWHLSRCLQGSELCNRGFTEHCRVHAVFDGLENRLKGDLQKISLQDIQ